MMKSTLRKRLKYTCSLVELERAGDEELGRFTRWDWVLVVLTSLVLPYFIVWWFA